MEGSADMLKVFQMNEWDWWVAHTALEALEDYNRIHDVPTVDARELSMAELESLHYRDPDGSSRTFASELRRRQLLGDRQPGLFASTEF